MDISCVCTFFIVVLAAIIIATVYCAWAGYIDIDMM